MKTIERSSKEYLVIVDENINVELPEILQYPDTPSIRQYYDDYNSTPIRAKGYRSLEGAKRALEERVRRIEFKIRYYKEVLDKAKADPNYDWSASGIIYKGDELIDFLTKSINTYEVIKDNLIIISRDIKEIREFGDWEEV